MEQAGYAYLSDSVKILRVVENETHGTFELEGLYRGYGVTIGNALRRVMLSSLPGAAITRFKIKGVGHEFTAVSGVIEDVVEIGLNLKAVRFTFNAKEPQVLTLKVKGEKEVKAGDIKGNADVIVKNPDQHIATLTGKNAELDMELTIEKGLGYVPVLAQKTGKLPVGTMALDAIFSPVRNVSFSVSNMRVGERIDYNKITLNIETDGTLSPSRALHKASKILLDHFKIISDLDVKDAEEAAPLTAEEGKKAKKTRKALE
ncbi:MAG: DNA-directed RNA polymerase subunit alpha [Candidatus Colwellbacteria bacterium]|nr:DNA-directed RNA polymerase subunit alpha [Candidatus Colwellbacteria bacterium]